METWLYKWSPWLAGSGCFSIRGADNMYPESTHLFREKEQVSYARIETLHWLR